MKPRDRAFALTSQYAGARSWYDIRNSTDAATDVAEVLLYDEIGWYGVSAADFARELATVDASAITVRINSPGGDVYDALAILNALRGHSATITTVVDGLAASAASFIAQAGDVRLMRPNSQVMIHDSWGVAVGDAEDLRKMADELERASNNIASIYADRAGGTVEDWRAVMRAETWFSDAEAVEAGLADRVEGKADATESARAAAYDLSIFNHAGRRAAPAPRLPHNPSAVHAEVTPGEEGTTMPTLIEGLRERLGLPEDADEATVLAAVDTAVTAVSDEDEEQTPAEPTLQQVAATAKRLGLVLVDGVAYAETVQAAAKGAQAWDRQQADHRNRLLDTAIGSGRIAPSQREHFAALLEADPVGTETLLAQLAPGIVPVNELGHAGEPTDTADGDTLLAQLWGPEFAGGK